VRGRSLGAADPRSLSDLQVNADPQGRFRITKTDTTDPSRSVLLMRVQFESLTKEPLHLYVVYDPSLSGNGDDDSGSTVGSALVADDATSAMLSSSGWPGRSMPDARWSGQPWSAAATAVRATALGERLETGEGLVELIERRRVGEADIALGLERAEVVAGDHGHSGLVE